MFGFNPIGSLGSYFINQVKQLKQYLKTYIKDINKNNLDFSISKGTLELKNIVLNNNLFNVMTFKLEYGYQTRDSRVESRFYHNSTKAS